LERAIAARWNEWVPWVRMHLLRQHQSDSAVDPAMDGPEARRLRQRHSEVVIAMLRDGITMRTIRRHRLDDPRITDDVRAMLVEAARERQSKARCRRPEDQRKQDRLRTLIRLGPMVGNVATQRNGESPQGCPPEEMVARYPSSKEAIQAIRRLVCERFYLLEIRDPELTARTNRRACVFPRQLAMYVVKQVTAASLEEIGREFGGRHHTTVLHSINTIERMRRLDKELSGAITQLMDALQQ
jgi:hypothetical protein